MAHLTLERWQPRHRWFIGVDSDGCAFDSMTLKHRHAFIPAAIEIWKLQPVAEVFAAAEEYINLASWHRGINRFAGLLLSFRRLQEQLGPLPPGATLPDLDEIGAFVGSGLPQSNEGLSAFLDQRPSDTGQRLLAWSLMADAAFARGSEGQPPFPGVVEALAHAATMADLMVVSAASNAGLQRDWHHAGLLRHVPLVGGQELGSKAEQVRAATSGRYAPECVLILGDAPGDLDAARTVGASFFPIMPGDEPASWRRFREEILPAFVDGQYAGALENTVIAGFVRGLRHEPAASRKAGCAPPFRPEIIAS